MDGLLVFPNAADELKPWHVRELRTRRTLIPEGRAPCRRSARIRNRGVVLEDIVRRPGGLRQSARQCARKEDGAIWGCCFRV